MKKWLSLNPLLFLTLVMVLIMFANPFTPTAQGKVIGEVLNTDIAAYIDGHAIRSYNINGWTGIVAEDLRDYGFDVYWDEEQRTLHISYYKKPDFRITTDYKPEKSGRPIGSHAMDVFKTDIKTYVNGDEVEAFNIGGRTIIYIDWLQCYGNVQWFEDERKICYTYVEPWIFDLYETNYAADTSDNINSFSLNAVKNENGVFDTSGDNLDYLNYLKLYYSKKNGMQFGFSVYQRVLFQTEELSRLLWDMSTAKYDGAIMQENADIANEHLKVFINGEPVKIIKVTQGRGNGHMDFYFWLDCRLSKEEIKTVNITCN